MPVPHRPLRALAAVAMALGVALAGAAPTTAARPDDAGDRPAVRAAAAGTTTATARAPSTATARTTPERARKADDSPLRITIDELTPGVLPRRGPLVVSGTITNSDVETWRDLNLYPLFSAGPNCTACADVMTTTGDLALAAETDPSTPVGERYTDDEQVRAQVGTLAPGQSATYAISIPQRVLRDLFGDDPTPGVYWFGVHALGSSDSSPRDTQADGRARTFLPYLPAAAPVVDTAVVLPLQAPIVRGVDGTLASPSSWQSALGVDGRLGAPLAFGAAAGERAVTWLVDPAVPDAVRQLALGNPARSLKPDTAPADPADPSVTAQATEDPTTRSAIAWLSQARSLLSRGTLARLPYGDPDLGAVGDDAPRLYRTARRQAATVLGAWGLDGVPVATGPDGYLDRASIAAVNDDATLLLGDQLFTAEDFSDTPPVDGLIGQRPVVVTSTEATEGGPAPTDALAPVALRQRLLGEVVVRALAATRDGDRPSPLAVVLPASLQAAGAAAFWAGLDQPWLRLVGLDALRTPAGDPARPDSLRAIDPDDLAASTRADDDQLPAAAISEAGRLIRSARVLQSVLGEGATIGDRVVAEALAGISYAQRGDREATTRLARTRAWVEQRLGRISIDGPDGVTLSSSSGSFNVALRNGLDQPVTVTIKASSDAGADVRVQNPITIAARSSVSVPVETRMRRAGVHNVVLRVVDADGDPVGDIASLPVRSGQVGIVIWVVIGSGAVILFGAIALRLRRRIRGAGERATAAPEDDAAAAAAAER